MYNTRIKSIVGALVFLAITAIALQPIEIAQASDAPVLPAQCSSIEVPAGNKLSFHTYARGVQVYKWTSAGGWVFVAPVATLFAEENFHGEVGIHYVGPKWESKSGSKVEARRVPNTGCTPDPTAIPWLLLSRFDSTGPGIFEPTTFIQRVNTTGGLAPSEPGTEENELKEVPYTAEYYFYRAQN